MSHHSFAYVIRVVNGMDQVVMDLEYAINSSWLHSKQVVLIKLGELTKDNVLDACVSQQLINFGSPIPLKVWVFV